MPALGLFEAYGIELEYMIVDERTLDVAPVCDRLLHAQTGNYEGEAPFDDITWSNELALHVVELKTSAPAPALGPLAAQFQRHIAQIERALEPFGARLMPGAMHPWMNPDTQMRLWPHDNSPIYRTFDRIFDCRGHGWSNLQSMHVNLPFANDEEFGRLHAAIRLVLPILPALAASSPVMDGRVTGYLDNRLRVYRNNAARVPAVAGHVVPEPLFSHADYRREIFDRLDRDIAPHDPEGILHHEWLNSRGAIARFSRGTIEIRVIDVQECPAADLAIATVACELVRALVEEQWTGFDTQKTLSVESLRDLLWRCVDEGDAARIEDRTYLEAMGFDRPQATAGELWRDIVERLSEPRRLQMEALEPLTTITREGPLARRLLLALGASPTREHLFGVYERLCNCLRHGTMFHA
jgi:glutamate---cysteine ligase / carboxylate-amine ligase